MQPASTAVIAWWAGLSLVSVINLATWGWIAAALLRSRADPASLRWQRWQLALCALFVFGCAYRSFLPRTEAQRFSMIDSWISSAPLARIAATLAELAFVAQVALVLHACASAAGLRFAKVAAWLIVPLIALAEVFSWYSALTTNFFGSVLEESIWPIALSLAVAGFALVRSRFFGPLKKAITLAIAAGIAYVLFMCTVDVPMYWRRWARDEAAGHRYLTIAEGWSDAWERRVVTRRWEDWREEMPWMSLYFSACVWLSLAMASTRRETLARSTNDTRSLP
jgi:hypothetical protein